MLRSILAIIILFFCLINLNGQPDSEFCKVDGIYIDSTRLLNIDQIQNLPLITKYSKRESNICLLYTSPSPRDKRQSRMPSSA